MTTKKPRTAPAETPRTPLATWAPKNEKAKHKCGGACGRTLPASKFPTVHRADGSIRRGGECRECRDVRTGRRPASGN